jgi:hypothetical protein
MEMNCKFSESSVKENFYGYWLYSEPKEYLLELDVGSGERT